jgi:hypothetical protein
LGDSIQRIVVQLHVGSDRMAGTDDPVFLGLRGPAGREFRLLLGKGKTFRRKGEERYVFGAPGDEETNVAHADLNDPTTPPLDAAGITGVYLCKRQEPIPNVRGFGEMDDRLQLDSVSVEIASTSGTRRFERSGPLWLGLTCGLSCELAPAGDG